LIVGRIGYTKVKLQPHGNYYDKEAENTLSKAHLQFNLERPEDDHDFM
jgi:hypothetical protein